MREKKTFGRYLITYTVLFAVMCVIVFLPFLLSGKSMIGNGDGQSQYILQLEYMGRYLREWFSSMAKGSFIPRRYDFTIGMGDDISSVVRFHPLDFLSVFVPSAHTEGLYHVLIILRLYLAGLAFSLLALWWKKKQGPELSGSAGRAILAGCFVYLFNGYTFCLGIVHPIYLSPLITLPLLLYAAERIMEDPVRYRFGLFTAMVALGFISNYYFMYIESIALLFYVIVRFFQIHAGEGGGEKAKAFISLFFRMTAAYAAGLMLSAVTLFPVLSRYLSSYRSERISEVNNLLIYADRRRYIAWLINLISPLRASGNGTHLNYAFIVLPAIVMLFVMRKKTGQSEGRRQARQLLMICTAACLVCLLVPAGGYVMAVMNNENNRWVFLIALAAAGTVSFEWDELAHPDSKGQKALMAAAAVFGLLILAESVIIGPDIYNIAAFVQLGVFTAAVLTTAKKRRQMAGFVLMLCVLVSSAANALMTFGRPFGNLVRYYMPAGSSLRTYRESVYSNYPREDDDVFYRSDGIFAGNKEDNAALYLGYRGVQMYNSVLNRDQINALIETGNPGLTTMLHIHNLDGHTVMSGLSSVRYFLTDEANSGSVPAGYSKTPVLTDSGMSLYENEFPSGIAFERESVLSAGEAAKLNPAELELAMQSCVIVDDEDIPEGAVVTDAESVRRMCQAETVSVELPAPPEGIERTDTGYIVRDTSAVLELDVPLLRGRECYILFEGLEAASSCKMRLRSGNVSKSVTLLNSKAQYTMGRNEYAVRAGCGGDDEDRVSRFRIRFTKKGRVDLESISLVYADKDACLERLKADSLRTESVDISGDTVRIGVESASDGMQVFSIPWSSGWSVMADGEAAEPVCADMCFTGVFLKKGVHEIQLTYHSPGLKMGVWTALCAVLLIIVLILIRRKQRCRVIRNRITV